MPHFAEMERLRERPEGKLMMRQSWRDLAFYHRAHDPSAVQSLLPPGLTVETFEGKAWVGFVPFRMEDIRFVGLPAMPGLRSFPETNVRTYVLGPDGVPGVWFFSLDATNPPAVAFARRAFGLNYVLSNMAVERDGDSVRYEGKRVRRSRVAYEARVRLEGGPAPAAHESFEFWLVERYLLYALRRGKLVLGRVWHLPYSLRPVVAAACAETVLDAQGLRSGSEWDHVAFSDGVDVEVFAPSACLGDETATHVV